MMVIERIKRMISVGPALLGVFCMLTVLYGCSVYKAMNKSTRQIARKVKTTDRSLTKRIALTQFENKTVFQNMMIEQAFQLNLVQNMEKLCAGILILKEGEQNYPASLKDLPKLDSGRIDSLNLVKAAKIHGLNAVLTGKLVNISGEQRDKGFWWFKDVYYYFQVQLMIEAYDVETGTKILDKSYTKETEIDEFEVEMIMAKKKLDARLLEAAMSAIAESMSQDICDAIAVQNWKGYVASLNDAQVIISVGQTSGLEEGDVLEVFSDDKIIEGLDDHRFILPGPKIGEVRVVEVQQERTIATVISGSGIREGSVVKLK